MFTELNKKCGSFCEPAKRGELRCPLIVRPTSEDVVTDNIFSTLNAINSRWWLASMLNTSLGTAKFHQQIYRDFRLQLWRKQPRTPRYLLPWEEGSTEVDVELSWENPSTTVFIEMKYGSSLSPSTVNCNGNGAFAADQLIRNVRVGLHKCGWYREDLLFRPSPRNFVVMVFAPTSGNALVQKYRDRMQLLKSIPFAEKLVGLPTVPFVGELRYSQLVEILIGNLRFMSQSERVLVSQLERYLDLKLSQL